jgi:hypothetical protein
LKLKSFRTGMLDGTECGVEKRHIYKGNTTEPYHPV